MSISIGDYQIELESEIEYLKSEIDKINSQINKINNETDFTKTQINKEFGQTEPENPNIWLIIENKEGVENNLSKEEILESTFKLLNLL